MDPLAPTDVIDCADLLESCAAEPGGSGTPEPAEPSEIDDQTSAVIYLDRLAALASREGAWRLERAAAAVQHHAGAPSVSALDGGQQRLLQGVASGTPIVDLAAEFGYPRSSMYRELSKLRNVLGDTDRDRAIRKAAEEVLLA